MIMSLHDLRRCFQVHADVFCLCQPQQGRALLGMKGGEWAARYHTWLLIKSTPKGVLFCCPFFKGEDP